MTTTIRPAVDADLAALITLSHRTIAACYRPFLGAEAVEAFLSSGAADRYVRENLGQCVVIEEDGKVVGYAVWRDNLIDLMMIDQARHRRGLGTRLLEHVEASLFQRYDELRLESFEANEVADAFYRKNGWMEVGRSFDKDAGADKIVFGKPGEPGRAGNVSVT